MSNYINDKIYGIPKPLRAGHNTSPDKLRVNKEYVHRVSIKGNTYYKCHIKRQGISKIKYFKTFKDAKFFVEMLRENKYL